MEEKQNEFLCLRALIIDDDQTDIFITHRILTKHSFAKIIIEKTSAKEALEYISTVAKEDLPEFIFLDLNMPAMDGFEFLQEFEKSNDAVKQTCKVAVLANYLLPEDIERVKAYPFVVAWFNKPVEAQHLERIVNSKKAIE